MSVLKDFGQFCSNPNQLSPLLRERQIEDHGTFGVYWYRRPVGHTKSGARHRGETAWITEWAFVRKSEGVWLLSKAIPGFDSKADAMEAAK
jgi:hypothetical protein